ncbi:hypothetical protein AYI69_g9343 [Smittium culicis]|uniref:CCHC-type domain-containing protein n=1 Tax=Smittium culicis TaxID=133412 RepID=A0A1R1XDD8_9FUNG|nr:hypothetical protein AYI69_g9343 [Smittium culicis]
MDVKVLLLWKGAQPICTYCKKEEHWKYQCEDLKDKIEKQKKRNRISIPKNSKKKFIHEKNPENIENNDKYTAIVSVKETKKIGKIIRHIDAGGEESTPKNSIEKENMAEKRVNEEEDISREVEMELN